MVITPFEAFILMTYTIAKMRSTEVHAAITWRMLYLTAAFMLMHVYEPGRVNGNTTLRRLTILSLS